MQISALKIFLKALFLTTSTTSPNNPKNTDNKTGAVCQDSVLEWRGLRSRRQKDWKGQDRNSSNTKATIFNRQTCLKPLRVFKWSIGKGRPEQAVELQLLLLLLLLLLLTIVSVTYVNILLRNWNAPRSCQPSGFWKLSSVTELLSASSVRYDWGRTHDSKIISHFCSSNGNQVTSTGHCVTEKSNLGIHTQEPSSEIVT